MKIIYRAFLLLVIVILITTVIAGGTTIDIHIHDTKIVIAYFHISLLLLFYVLLLTTAYYWISRCKNHVSSFQWIVFIMTVLIFFWILCVSFFQSNRFVGRTIDISSWHSFNQFQKLNEITSVLSLFFVSTHLAFWVYFLVVLVRKFLFRLHKN